MKANTSFGLAIVDNILDNIINNIINNILDNILSHQYLPFHEWRRGRTRRPPGCMRPRGRRFPGSRSTRRSGRRPRCRSALRTWTTTSRGPIGASEMDLVFCFVIKYLIMSIRSAFVLCTDRILWFITTFQCTICRKKI